MIGGHSDRPAVVLAVVIVAVLIIGEVIVYTSDYTDYSTKVSYSSGEVSYEITSEGSKQYSVVISDGGGYTAVDRLLMFYDSSYPDYDDGYTVDQMAYLSQIQELLRFRNVDAEIVNAETLEKAVTDGIYSETCAGTGILVVSGILPDCIYTGSSGDPLFKWLNAGGSLYFVGGLIGRFYGTPDGAVEVPGYQNLMFGSECLFESGDHVALEEVSSNGYTEALCLQNNDVLYGVNPSMLPEGTASLSIGFEKDGYASTTLVGYGDGMICVFGGRYSTYEVYDVAQVIASGLGPMSRMIGYDTGVCSGEVHGSVDVNGHEGGMSAYVFLGGYYPVYGKLTRLRS